MRDIYEIEAELQQLIESAITELRTQLRQEAADLLQESVVLEQEPQAFSTDTARGASVSLWDKSAENIADLGTFAALSALMPIQPQVARLPASLQGDTVFRPALRRLGTLAGRSAAAAIFDSSQGSVGYSSRQAGQRLLQELFMR
jgi:hypothetical protein